MGWLQNQLQRELVGVAYWPAAGCLAASVWQHRRLLVAGDCRGSCRLAWGTHPPPIELLHPGRLAAPASQPMHPSVLLPTPKMQRCLCTGEKGVGRSGKPLHFKGSTFHRVIPQARVFSNQAAREFTV